MATNEYNGPELFPPPGHPVLGYKIIEALSGVMENKKGGGLHEKWVKAYEFSRNQHWRNPNVGVQLVSANLLFNHRQRTVAQLTDNNPTFNVRQVGEVEADKEEIFEILLRTAEFWWSDQEQQNVLERSVINGEMYGGTAEKVYFNPESENMMGEVETMVVDPFYFGWLPVKQPYDPAKSEAVFYFYPESVRRLRRRYPDKAKLIKSDSEILKELGDTRLALVSGGQGKKPQGYLATFSGIIKNLVNTADGAEQQSDETLFIEVWFRDYSTDKTGAYIYPGAIRRVALCSGGEVILADDPNPSINPNLDPAQSSLAYLYSRFPFTYTQSITDNVDPWGVSDFEQLVGLQVEVNKTLSQGTNIKDALARMKIINPADSGVANSSFTEKGIINPTTAIQGQGIRFMEPPRIPPELFGFMDLYKELFTAVSGAFELEAIQKDGTGQIAYKSIAALLERAQTILRSKVRNYSKMIRERGRMYLSCAMNWYTEPRWISYEEDGETMGMAITGTEIMIPAKLNVVSGSTMPVSRIQEREEALNLFQQGAIDQEELLKKMDWPDWKKVVERTKAGPIGEFVNRLAEMGFPPEMLQIFSEIAMMEGKDFEKALKDGEIPPASELIPGPEDYGPPQEPQIPPDMQAQLEEVSAKIRKLMAETDLTREKINTEKVQQQVSMAGVQFDQDKLTIERAKTVADIQSGMHKANLDEEIQTQSAKQKVQGAYREKGMQSNNKPATNKKAEK